MFFLPLLQTALFSFCMFEQGRGQNPITIYAGQSRMLEITERKDGSPTMTTVTEVKDTATTVIISMRSILTSGDGGIHSLGVLNIRNPLTRSLVYRAEIQLAGQADWKPVETLTLGPKLRALDAGDHSISAIMLDGWKCWDQPISAVRLDDWKFSAN